MAERKRGRPHKAVSTETPIFSMRLKPELRKDLKQAAEMRGNALTEEIHSRLTRSFQLDDEAKRRLASFGGPQNYAAVRVIADLMKNLATATGKSWADDPWTYEQLRQGIAYLLEQWRPSGEHEPPALQGVYARRFLQADLLGDTLARHVLARLDFTEGNEGDVFAQIKADLGSLATRGGHSNE